MLLLFGDLVHESTHYADYLDDRTYGDNKEDGIAIPNCEPGVMMFQEMFIDNMDYQLQGINKDNQRFHNLKTSIELSKELKKSKDTAKLLPTVPVL